MLLRDTRRCIVSLVVLVTVFFLIVTWNYTRKGYADVNVPFIYHQRQWNETTAGKVGRGDNTRRPNTELQTENILTEKLVDQPKVILLWNTFYAKKDFHAGGYGRDPFLKCPQQNCFLTRDRGNLSQASAVLFHMYGGVGFPTERDPDQLYVFVVRESPRTYHVTPNTYSQFNLTMTYSHDSDVPIPVGQTYRKSTASSMYELKFPFANRTRNVAWVVSHCDTDSKRELYVRELRRHIDVDIYGKCGRKDLCNKKPDFGCFRTGIPAKYKFYLGFENSVCEDYVTEKMFRPLQNEIVPVVYGGTNYSRDAPPHSVINIEDYSSPKELAQYLKRLSSNETEYKRYFDWKKTHAVMSPDDDPGPMSWGFCKLCEIVHQPSFRKTYRDVERFWSQSRCKSPRFVLNQLAQAKRGG